MTFRFCTTEYLVTDQKVMEKYGWISTHTDEMPLSKIENVVVNYTFWGKIFNYGTVICQGTNRNNVSFYYVKDAESIKKELNELI
ncbi:MAG: PH domain-containing protein [Clostridia bacterium]|nr:PH domain-containing protein [Clostridia bacterium]